MSKILNLIEVLRPGSTLDEIEYYVKLLNRYYKNTYASNIGASKKVPDSHFISDVLKKKLLGLDDTAKKALEFSRAVSRIKNVCLIDNA
jgi:hypothetical protein